MGKKKQAQKFFVVLMMVILLIGMIPGVASAYTSDDGSTWLGWLNFATSADATLIAGEARNIHVQLCSRAIAWVEFKEFLPNM